MCDANCKLQHALSSVAHIDFLTSGIRSLSFHNEVVTIGTGFGSCSFLDLRTNKFLQKQDGNVCQLKAGEGWLVSLE